MAIRITLVWLFLVGVSGWARAQDVLDEPAELGEPAKLEVQADTANGPQIALEVRPLVLSDTFIRLLRERRGAKRLPTKGAGAVLGPEEASLLLAAASGDRAGRETPPQMMLKLPSGARQELSLFGPQKTAIGKDSAKATLSDDRQAVQLQLTRARRKGAGCEPFPTIDAAVPLGSHLLVHTATLSASKSTSWPLNELDLYADKLLGLPEAKPNSQQEFLLVTPSIAVEPREGDRLGKKEDDRSVKK